MKDRTVTCDGCGADITTTGNCVDYRLALTVERIQVGGPIATLMHIEPPLEDDKDFCSLRCLADWLERSGIHPNDPSSPK